VASGAAPAGTRVAVTLLRNGRKVATKRVKASSAGKFRATFHVRRAGRYTAKASGSSGDTKLRARSRSVRLR
jgi:hypothetical protein